jgi:hypothetical protein
MGLLLFDQYSYLHFAVGIIFYFWNISFNKSLFLHTIFEIGENTNIGMKLINNFSFWPGGKNYRDSNINIIGDTIAFIIGFISARFLDNYGYMNKWFEKHIK